MKLFKKAILMVAISIFVMGISGCKEKGTAEKAGEKIDDSMQKAGDAAKDLVGK
ncbi:MAG: transport-associated protein [Nitrospinae bacterium]|nr:transport-associated protein [Nitrospinota bacterium]MDA1108980.1 transport-associated protein [Nitrospinota bacterium]